MGRPPGSRNKLSDVMAGAVAREDADVSSPAVSDVITVAEAKVLASLGMSGAEVNDKARRAMTYFLEALVSKSDITDDEAKACLDVLKQAATADQKALCNKVLYKYVGKFDFAFAQSVTGNRAAARAKNEQAVTA